MSTSRSTGVLTRKRNGTPPGKRLAIRHRDQFYADVCAYIRDEPNDIRPGTIGEIQAKIAKTLVVSDAALVQPENKDRLLVRNGGHL